ncbi:MAG: monophosphatase [Actinomycetota bacterium]|nr:monophosphatase [Actinomycetota bacterium]
MKADELDQLLAIALDAARIGGKIVAEEFGAPREVREKAPGDWVSGADLRSEAAVRAALVEARPDIPVFGEEAGGARGPLGWLVDPLDGTANFLHGLEAVGVSIGLVEDDVPIVGVVHAPLLGGRTYWGRSGGGAFRDGEPIRVSDRAPAQAICATGFPFRHKDLIDGYLAVLSAAMHSLEDLRRVGGASLDLSWTAQGVFDGYFELALGPWDVAAGGLLVREAGGVVTDWAGDDGAWLASGNVVAGSPAVHELLLELIANNSFDRPDMK